MTPATIYSFDVPPNGAYRLIVAGQFFKVLACLGALDVQTENCNLKGLGAGDGLEKTPFSWLTLTDRSGATNTVRLVVSDAAFINSPQVSTSIVANRTTVSASFANAQKTVTNASALLVASNAARQYLLIQNKDPTGSIFVSFGTGFATTANGLRIGPGGSWEWDSTVSSQSLNAVGDIASNANVVIVEG